MRTYRFLQVDVFTDRPFGGNPLAVFPDAEGLSGEEMRRIAQEMNLSETTFVLPSDVPGADFRVRIFTPAKEMPFAGHPVVGTHWTLAHLGRVQLSEPVTTVRFHLGVGVLPADLYVEGGRVQRVVMTQGKAEFLGVLDDLRDLAAGLGLPEEAIRATGLPVQVVSTGVPQMMVPVRSLAEVQRLGAGKLDAAALARVCERMDTDCVAVFCLQTEDPAAAVHVRMFAPLLGVGEDPATGSANGGLGAYLARYGVLPHMEAGEAADKPEAGKPGLLEKPGLPASTLRYTAEQGSEIGRPSRLHIEVGHEGEHVRAVRVGGQAALVAEGVVYVP